MIEGGLFWGNRRVMLLHKKNYRNVFLYTTLIITILCLTNVLFTIYSFPDEINVIQGQDRKLPSSMVCNLEVIGDYKHSIDVNNNKIISSFLLMEDAGKGKAKANLMLLGLLPVKQVTLNMIPDIKVVPSGEAIGVRIESKGVLVVGLSSITDTKGRRCSPAADAGFEVGDKIIQIADNQVEKERDIIDYLNNRHDKEERTKVLVERDGSRQDLYVKPVKCEEDGIYRIGLWVRDNIAGVGTMTFYDPKSRMFGALGHGITDVDSGVLVDINSGKIIKSKIASIQKAKKTVPGELVGVFYDSEDEYGIIYKNTSFGIYGKLSKKQKPERTKPVSIGLNSQIKEGPAKILTTIEGNKVEEFDIEIQKAMRQRNSESKSMIIRITDEKLIEKTGGIVQGMSGSPIIQDNKLVGCVTHVLVNDPTKGFGISIEWMLKEADIELVDSLKRASGE
ncbi:MAG TPA: SpoIVB peptidase [Bacillota bacterium]|nr:SpoIVB peptidase [Bacillota bacterium]HPA54636.1 SpoIVB peptidase [Bacillota bacterium]HQA64718.1 SpoIVB peptidase [Bacillota bacterium]